jgi:transposase
MRSAKDLNWNVQPIGRPKVVTDEYVNALRELVRRSPQDYGYPFKRWTANWLRCHLAKELEIEVSDRHINRLLAQMGLSTRKEQLTSVPDGSKLPDRARQILIEDLNPSAIPEFNWPFKDDRVKS